MKKQLVQLALVGTITCLLFQSCKEDTVNPSIDYSQGKLIVCEGNMGNNDGEITYIGDTSQVTNVFYTTNSIPLGDVVQSMTIIDNKAYIVVNNSQKVEVVNSKSFKSIATINGLSYPRSVTKLSSDKILISNGNGTNGDDYIYIVSTNTYSKIDSIAMPTGPEKIFVINNNIYVLNSGGWSNGNTISVFNSSNYSLIKTITVGDVPIDGEIDDNNNLIILCKGKYDWANSTSLSNAKIMEINATTNTASTIYELDHCISTYTSTNMVAYNSGKIYFIDDAVYSLSTTNTTPVKIIDGYYYSVDVDSSNGDIWISSVSSMDQHKILQYSSSGTKINEYNTSLYPNSVLF